MLSPFARRLAASGVLPPGASVLAACSGGADSVALVLGLDELRRDGLIRASVAHVHHGLRGAAADADLAAVRSLAASLGLAFHHRSGDASGEAARRRKGLEEAARFIRRQALEEMRAEAGCDVVALAHSADDQAETVLLRLLRGSGAEGLSAMPGRNGNFVRPMLAMRRSDVRAAVSAAGIGWASDETNWSPASARALVRELLGRLESSLDERVVERLCETADQLRDESAWMEAQARALLTGRLTADAGPEGLPLTRVRDADAIGAAPAPLRRRAVRMLLRDLRPAEPPPTSDAVRRAARLFEPPPRPSAALLAGLVLRRAGKDVVAGAERPWRIPSEPVLLQPGMPLRWAGGVLELGLPQSGGSALDHDDLPGRVILDAEAVAAGLLVRGRRPGDALEGRRGRRRLGELLARAGIPAAWRDAHPVVCLAPEAATIVWLAGLQADPRFRAAASSQRVVELSWIPAEPPTGAPE